MMTLCEEICHHLCHPASKKLCHQLVSQSRHWIACHHLSGIYLFRSATAFSKDQYIGSICTAVLKLEPKYICINIPSWPQGECWRVGRILQLVSKVVNQELKR